MQSRSELFTLKFSVLAGSLGKMLCLLYCLLYIHDHIYYYSMAPHGNEISHALRVAVVICRLLYHEEYQEIERKTGVKAFIAAAIMWRVIDKAGNEDLNDVLTCLGNWDRPGAFARVED